MTSNNNSHEYVIRGTDNKDIEVKNLIKALRESEEKLENSKLKTEFFSNISHEFKTPLNILMGSIQIIELYRTNGIISDPENKLNKYIKTMKQNAYRLLKLINNIIDLSKIDSSYYDIELHNYDIVTIVQDIINSIQVYANSKSVNVTLIKSVDHNVIACDVDKIERILLNLLSNALKFTNENGNIEVDVWINDGYVYISVKDDGIGIHKDKLNFIFQRFRQADKSFTRNRQGSGIGLSLVKALVEMHNGDISVISEYGKGSTFTFKLPDIALSEKVDANLLNQFEDTIMERIKVELSDI